MGQQGTLMTVWAKKGSRPTAVKQIEYDWVYLYGRCARPAMIAGSIGIAWMNVHLPSYSPELNPVENLWHWLRSHSLSNRVYRDVPHPYDAVDHAWNSVTSERLNTMCRATYMERELDGSRIRRHSETMFTAQPRQIDKT